MNRRTLVGVLVILWGISFLIPFPIGKIAIGIVFCYVGLTIITGKNHKIFQKNINSKDNIFTESYIKCDSTGEYNIVFASSDIVIDNDSKDCTINVVFGSADINILTERPIFIKAEAVFSTCTLPNGNRVSFGDTYYKADGIGEALNIKISTVFANTEIKKI